MPGRLRKRLTFANVTSVVALFFAIGGSAYAAVIVTSNGEVAPDTIAGHKPGAGQHSNLILGSVANEDLAPDTIKGGRIFNGTVAATDLGTNSVDRSKVADSAIGSAELGVDSVGANQLQHAVFYDVGGESVNDPVGGPATDAPLAEFGSIAIIGRCSESSAGIVTSKVILRAAGITSSVHSTAGGGVTDATGVPSGTETTLSSLGPTTGAHVTAGSFGVTSLVVATQVGVRPITGTVVNATHAQGVDCTFGVTGIG